MHLSDGSGLLRSSHDHTQGYAESSFAWMTFILGMSLILGFKIIADFDSAPYRDNELMCGAYFNEIQTHYRCRIQTLEIPLSLRRSSN